MRTDTGRTVEVSSPDNVLVSGMLVSGAAVSVHVASVPWAGRGFRMEVYGRDGTLTVSGSVSSRSVAGDAAATRGTRVE